MATCPECDAEIEIDSDDLAELDAGDPWDCEACGSHLRVTGKEPLEFESDDEDEEEDEDDEEKSEESDDDDDFEDDADEGDETDDDKDWEE